MEIDNMVKFTSRIIVKVNNHRLFFSETPMKKVLRPEYIQNRTLLQLKHLDMRIIDANIN